MESQTRSDNNFDNAYQQITTDVFNFVKYYSEIYKDYNFNSKDIKPNI